MKWSQYFIPTMKEVPAGTEAVSHQLLLRAGLVQMLTSGVYSYLPLGLKVLRKIEEIIRQEMNAAGAHELLMPCLHPLDIWKQTGRDQTLSEVMIKFQDNKGREMCLGPTHEEIITYVAKSFLQSYKQLPVTLYQIQTKFRDELRTRFGIVRACEFLMKDAYSFDRDAAGLKKSYEVMYAAYEKIFARLGLRVAILSADSGAMGGDVSHEFMVAAPIGEDAIISCPQCGAQNGPDENWDKEKICPVCHKGTLKRDPALELGHIFQLGTKYSQALDAMFVDEDGQRKPFIMGCYGIGVSRVVAALIECNHDEKGIKWPVGAAPFDVQIVPLFKTAEDETNTAAQEYYQSFRQKGVDVLIDDRMETPGRKFNDADLIGIPWQVVVGQKQLAQGNVEIKNRHSGETFCVNRNDAVSKMMECLNNGC